MKIGDLIKWNDKHGLNEKPYMGIVVDGPREAGLGEDHRVSYQVAWFNAYFARAWHNDYCLELMSDCYRMTPDDLKGNEV